VELSAFHIIAILLSYFIGAIPTALFVGKTFYKIDIREYGSRNSGATNTFRVLGKKAGIPVLLFDVFKGWVTVYLSSKYSGFDKGSQEFITFQLIVGVAVVLGHVFSVYTKFKGGKGVATSLGFIIALHPQAALICLLVFLIVFFISRMVSLGALIAAICFPMVIMFVFKNDTMLLPYFSIFISLLVIFTHRKNIERLLKNEENKMNLGLKVKEGEK